MYRAGVLTKLRETLAEKKALEPAAFVLLTLEDL